MGVMTRAKAQAVADAIAREIYREVLADNSIPANRKKAELRRRVAEHD